MHIATLTLPVLLATLTSTSLSSPANLLARQEAVSISVVCLSYSTITLPPAAATPTPPPGPEMRAGAAEVPAQNSPAEVAAPAPPGYDATTTQTKFEGVATQVVAVTATVNGNARRQAWVDTPATHSGHVGRKRDADTTTTETTTSGRATSVVLVTAALSGASSSAGPVETARVTSGTTTQISYFNAAGEPLAPTSSGAFIPAPTALEALASTVSTAGSSHVAQITGAVTSRPKPTDNNVGGLFDSQVGNAGGRIESRMGVMGVLAGLAVFVPALL